MENPVRWFEIYIDNTERSKKFYETVFQIKLEKLGNPNSADSPIVELWKFPSEMNAPGCSGALAKMKDERPSGAGTIVYFGSDDCSVEEKRIPQAGGKIHRPKTSIGEYGFIVLAQDTEGNMFGVHSME